MNRFFADMIEKYTSKVNEDVVNGLATEHLKHVESYIDMAFKSANHIIQHLDSRLVYEGYERCTPEEEFLKRSRKYNYKYFFDLDRSDFYMVKYRFRYDIKTDNGYKSVELQPVYLYLPFVNEAGTIHIHDVVYHISPVLTDKVISPNKNDIFIKLLKIKMIFYRVQHFSYTILENGINQPYTKQSKFLNIVYCNIYNKQSKSKTEKFRSSNLFFLLGKYGFTRVFEKYCGVRPILIKESEYNYTQYPIDEYVVCTSKGTPPIPNMKAYTKPDCCIIIPKDKYNHKTHLYVGNFFYIADFLGDKIIPEIVDDILFWQVELGTLLYGNKTLEFLLSKMKEHYQSMDYYINEYADVKIIQQLSQLGYEVYDFYDLLDLIIEHYDRWLIENEKNAISIYNRYIEILYYILYDLTTSIFNVYYKFMSQTAKKKSSLSVKEVNDILHDNKNPNSLKVNKIFSIASTQNLALSTVDYSGDTKYPHITSIVALQEHGEGVRRAKRKRVIVDHTKHIHPSKIVFGSMHSLPKRHPTPEVRINPFIQLDKTTHSMVIDKEVKKALDNLEQMLNGILPEGMDVKFVDENNEEE